MGSGIKDKFFFSFVEVPECGGMRVGYEFASFRIEGGLVGYFFRFLRISFLGRIGGVSFF